MSGKLIIIDFGMGNLHSILRKFERLSVPAEISADKAQILAADKLILPGVGHFKKAVENLKQTGLWDTLNIAVLEKKIPVLGICLGMQLMAKHSEEGDVKGFGWFDAEVVRFRIQDTLAFKIPHTGWNQITKIKESPLMNDIPDLSEYYFVHAYHFQCNNSVDTLNETEYEYKFTSAVERDNIFGVQYHPEKSHDIGETLLRNFANL